MHHQETGFHEVDSKRWETRQCVVFGLGISAIVMISVTLEECLKTLLKYHRFLSSLHQSQEFSLEEWERASLEAEDIFGSFKLHNAIEKARKEELITEDEEKILLGIKDTIRNAFIHSDKAKMFDGQSRINVQALELKDNKIQPRDSRQMSILGLNIAQGFAQKQWADREALDIVEKMDTIIVTICERFWRTHPHP